MTEYVKVYKDEDTVEVCFYIEKENVLLIGQKMNEINENAYMNGYNWEAFFKTYLAQQNPDLLDGLDHDPEAGTYVGYYKLTKENELKANRFSELIISLVENAEKLYNFLREKGNDIEWD